MRIAISNEFRVAKKEPLVDVVERICGSFLATGLGEPRLHFAFSDSSEEGRISAVSRVLKKMPELLPFATEMSEMPLLLPPVRTIANLPGTPGHHAEFPSSPFAALLAGIPKAFPFAGITLSFSTDDFGAPAASGFGADLQPGVHIEEAADVFGRRRSMSSIVIVEGEASGKKAPPPPTAIARLHESFGKAKKSSWMPVADAGACEPAQPQLPPLSAAAHAAIAVVAERYRQDWPDLAASAKLPYDLPPPSDLPALGQATGPKKPVLTTQFKRLGYHCEAGSGTFTLTRITEGNLKVEVYLDVGTWSHQLTASYRIEGAGIAVGVPLPPCARTADARPYPICGAEAWTKIVANLAVLTELLDRTLAKQIEAIAGPAPAWVHNSA